MFIIVPVRNRSKITNKFADCLLNQTYTNFHLLLIDDGSSDDTISTILKKIKKTTVIRGDGSLWWAGAIQLGINWLKKNIKNKEELVLITNDDITFDKAYLENGINTMKEVRDSILVTGYKNNKNVDPFFCFNDSNGKFINKSEPRYERNCFSMNSVFLKFNYFETIGDFYPKLLPHYLADIEFSFRAIKKGYTIITSKNVKVTWDLSSTGIHKGIKDINGNFFNFMKTIFNKKFSGNPMYWSIFLCLTVKKKKIFTALFNYWLRFSVLTIFKFLPIFERIYRFIKKDAKK